MANGRKRARRKATTGRPRLTARALGILTPISRGAVHRIDRTRPAVRKAMARVFVTRPGLARRARTRVRKVGRFERWLKRPISSFRKGW